MKYQILDISQNDSLFNSGLIGKTVKSFKIVNLNEGEKDFLVVKLEEIIALIDEMIKKYKNGMERHKEYSVIYSRYVSRIESLTELKNKIK